MAKIKLFLISLVVIGLFFAGNAKSLAATKIGIVDMAQLVQNYDRAKEVQADFQVSQAKIKKMIEDARAQVSKIEEDEARKETEKKLTDKILKENEALKDDFTKKWQDVQTNILTSINVVAQKGKYDLVINKQSVITGGEDITNKVLAELQSKAENKKENPAKSDKADKANKSNK